MRHPLFVIGCMMSVGLLCGDSLRSADPKPETDPWVGSYLKYGGYDSKHGADSGLGPVVTITKEGDAYKMNGLYDICEFKETEKGVLSNRTYGKLFLATAEFHKGDPARILRAEMCYERFILYRTLVKIDKTDSGKETEKRAK